MTESYKCSFLVSKIKKLKNSDFVVLRFWPGTGSYLYYCNFIKKRGSNTGVFLWVLQPFWEHIFWKYLPKAAPVLLIVPPTPLSIPKESLVLIR